MTTHTLYRFFDHENVLLYVGRTINPSQRWRTHERKQPWFDEVASLTRVTYETAEEVDVAERRAILTEGPRYNIALVPGHLRTVYVPKAPTPIGPSGNARWAALGLTDEDVSACDGEETVCECRACHGQRLSGFEDIETKYGWHPDVVAALASAKRKYYEGWDLFDWYYDYFDLEIFGAMWVAMAGAERPIPAYAEVDDRYAAVDCPFCFTTHKHALVVGLLLDQPFEAPCSQAHGGSYVLEEDWERVQDRLYMYGDQIARAAA